MSLPVTAWVEFKDDAQNAVQGQVLSQDPNTGLYEVSVKILIVDAKANAENERQGRAPYPVANKTLKRREYELESLALRG